MKKAGFIFVIITTMLCIFACGFLLGRNLNKSEIAVVDSVNTSLATVCTENSSQKINVNTASVDELTALPGIGNSLAQRIVDYRDKYGRFRTASDLLNVEGIGDKKLLAILDYITI